MSCGEHKSLGLGSNHQARWRPAKTGFVTVTLPPNQTVPVESEGGIPARIALVPVVCVKFSKLVGMVDCWVSRLCSAHPTKIRGTLACTSVTRANPVCSCLQESQFNSADGREAQKLRL